jgi:hypothetical protein
MESSLIFICDKCDYKTCKEFNYNKHLLTSKHKQNMLVGSNNNDTKLYNCSCGNTYKHRQGLWKHKSKHNCEANLVKNVTNNELKDILVEILESIKQ